MEDMRRWYEDRLDHEDISAGCKQVQQCLFKKVIVRAAQEGLNNVIKHAHASRAVVTLGLFEDAVTLDVVDNGGGVTASPSRDNKDHGFGLTGLRDRVESVGGTMNLESGEGTALAVRIPLKERSNG